MSPVNLDKTLTDSSDEDHYQSDRSDTHTSCEEENQGLKLRMSDKKLEMQLNRSALNNNPQSYESDDQFFSKANENQLKVRGNIENAYGNTDDIPRTVS